MKRTAQLLWFAILSTVVWALVMSLEAGQYKTQGCAKRGFVSRLACSAKHPIAQLELAQTPEAFKGVIAEGRTEADQVWNVEVARINTCMDSLFIALYWSVFVLLARFSQSRLGPIVWVAISGAAVADFMENRRLLQALGALSEHASFQHTAAAFSVFKWSAIGLSAFVLGVILYRPGNARQRGIAVLMMLSAAFTVAGLYSTSFLSPAMLLLLIALVIGIFRYCPYRPFSWAKFLAWLEFAYLIRFPLIAAGVLALALPIAYFMAPSIFLGIFDALGLRSFIVVVAALLSLAWTIMIICRMLLVYGPARFPGLKGSITSANLSWTEVLLFGELAAPCVVLLCCGTHLAWWGKAWGVSLGLLLALGGLWLSARLHFYFEPGPGNTARTVYPPFPGLHPSEVPRSAVGRRVDRVLEKALPGELQAGLLSEGRLRSGHQLAAANLLILIVVYVVIGLVSAPTMPIGEPGSELASFAPRITYLAGFSLAEYPPAALFYVLLLLMILTWTFSGIAFLVDVVRLPVLTSFTAFSLIFGTFHTDHLYRVDDKHSTGKAASPQEIIRAWERSRKEGYSKPIVVVATAGGGIRAAAWTAQVFTGLADRCDGGFRENKFTSAVVLVSSVSGGSVGSMYVVGGYDRNGQFHTELGQIIRDNAARTSLSAVAWGLVYPDLIRTIPIIGSFTKPTTDRGSALETTWVNHWGRHLWTSPPTLQQWTSDTARGLRPAAIFNATSAENGQRFLIGSTTMAPEVMSKLNDQFTIQFATEFSDYDVPISTAARLSATFPIVSPMARASTGPDKFRVHVADGGYYDNSGVLSATEWLLGAREALNRHPVILLLIDASSDAPAEGENWSWQRQAVAPVGTLVAVRGSSQQLRADYELELSRELLEREGINVTTARFSYPSDPLTPLSWHLTPQQQRRIGEAWSKPTAQLRQETDTLLDRLGCRAQ